MKFKCSIAIALVTAVIFSFSIANGQETPYSNMLKLMQEFHEASNDLQGEMFQSVFLIGETLHNEPDVSKLKSTSESLTKNAKTFEAASRKIIGYIDKNESTLSGLKDVLKKLRSESSLKDIAKLKSYVKSFNDFAQTAKETEFTVYSNENWANSGIIAEANDYLYVDAKGGWKVSRNYEFVGWKGYPCISSDVYRINNKAPLGALLFRVRGSSKNDGFALNEKKRGKLDSKGRLEFIINDTDRKNNQGQLDLKIVIINGEKFADLINTLNKVKEKN